MDSFLLIPVEVQVELDNHLDPRTIINAVLVGDTLEFTHLDNTVTQIPLDYIAEWQDLEHVKKYDDINILDYSKVVPNKAIDDNGERIDASMECGKITFKLSCIYEL